MYNYIRNNNYIELLIRNNNYNNAVNFGTVCCK